MTMLGRVQKAQIRREAIKLERERMRGHLKALGLHLRDLFKRLRQHRRTVTKEKRALLLERSTKLKESRSLSRQRRKAALAQVAKLRAGYREWSRMKHVEKLRLLSEVAHAGQEVKALSDWEKEHLPVLVARIEEQTTNALEAIEQQGKHTQAQLIAAIEATRRDIHAEKYDLKSYSENRRDEKVRQHMAARVSPRDFNAEVEGNLLTAEQLAYWHHERALVMRTAKQLGKTSPDQVAELVREQAEFDEDKAMQFLDADVAAWVKAETRRVANTEEEYPF
jgi:hypothetical protein